MAESGEGVMVQLGGLSRAVIPNVAYVYPQGYEPVHLGVREKKLNYGEKGHSYNM